MMIQKRNVKVGDQFYVRDMRRGTGATLTVDKVGRKYFTLTIWGREVQFMLETLREYNPLSEIYYLYPNEKQYREKQYREALITLISRYFQDAGMDLESDTSHLEAIAKLLNLKIPKKGE